MIPVDANPAVAAAFYRAKLGGWDVVDSSLGALSDAGAITEGVVSGSYDYLVPIVAVGVIVFTLWGE